VIELVWMNRAATLGALAMLVTACSSESDATPPSCEATAERPYVVTADWLNGSLTLLSMARLVDPNCSAQDAIVGRVDLSGHPPGPLELEIAPDGRTAVVSVGAGFFDSITVTTEEIPAGRELLIVDLETAEILHQIDTPDAPMGLAISPDGSTAYSANFGGGSGRTMSIVDIASGSVEHVDVGRSPEQVALNSDGTLGIINNAEEGGVRVFETSDAAGSQSALMTGSDPSDITFIDDTTALVTNSVSFDYALIDVSDMAAPTVIETQPFGTGIPYGATLLPDGQRVLATTFLSAATLVEIDVASRPTRILRTFPLAGGSFPLNAAVDPSGRYAFVAHAADRVLSVVDLDSGAVRGVSWLTRGGPTYAVVAP
jgi:DNA-binding beta-propeller fold protein YncE